MPSVNLRKAFYDELVRQGDEPAEAVNKAISKYLKEKYDIEVNA